MGGAAVNDESANPANKRWVKIAVPIVISLVIGGIFLFKNMGTNRMPPADAVSKYPLKITSVNLDQVKSYGIPTVIDFGSDSCIPCKEMAPVLETLNAEWHGVAAVQFIDVWKYSDGVSDFPVQVIPTQVFFTDAGEPFVPSDALAAEIEFTLYSEKATGKHVFTVHQGGITEAQMRKIFAEMGVGK